jgi:CDP-diacylglycerol---serine O-phosphatidyltransferase
MTSAHSENNGDEKNQHRGSADDLLLPVDERIEEISEGGKKVRHRGIYLLPNLFTTAALFSGFYAIISGMHGNFENAAIAIFVAMVLDGLDGRVARLTNTSSAFGVQYDSMSDLVSFGLAPSLVIFNWALMPLHKYGWAVAFAYAACAALRLARFNTQVGVVDKRYFIGLASPSAAALVAGTVWVGHDVEVGTPLSILAATVTLMAGLLMVSNLKYSSFKGIDFKGRVPFAAILAVVILFVIITANPSVVLLSMAIIYALSGPVVFMWKKWRRLRLAKRNNTHV